MFRVKPTCSVIWQCFYFLGFLCPGKNRNKNVSDAFFLSGCFPLLYFKSKYLVKSLWGQCFVLNIVNVGIWQVLEILSFKYCQSILNFLFLSLRCQHQSGKIYQLFDRNAVHMCMKKWTFYVKLFSNHYG